MSSIVSFKNINHSYDTKHIINNLSLGIAKNRITCLLGSSGCGKTTILRLIAGLEIPDNGNIFIDEVLVSKGKNIIVSPQKRKIGFIFQDLALWPHFTIYKNIAFGLKEINEDHIKDQVFEILDFFGLNESVSKFPNQLSGGQQQLVAIARSLVLKPKILLMDEPLTNLDVKLKRKILNYIVKLKQKFDLTIIYVTHNHKEAFEIADEIVIINNGEIVENGTVEQIKTSNNKYIKEFLEY